MSAQIYPIQTYKPSRVPAKRFPLANAANQQLPPTATTPQKVHAKPKQPTSPPLQRQNTKATPPSPPSIIRDNHGYFQFHRVGFLGEGGFARVYEAEDFRGTRVACKVVTRSSLTTKKTKTKLYAEIRIHKSLSHPNIVAFQECFEGDDNVYMILELCTSGSLMDMLRRRRRLSEAETRFFLVQIIGACHYMHIHQVIHRDLKLGNIFLDGKMNIKVGDFGLAALIENPGERKKTICGTPNYIAPEVLFDTANGHSFEVDTWSIGVILYTLVIGRPPFQTKDVKAIYKRIRDNAYEFPTERPISQASQQLIQSILAPKPQERPALLDVVHDDFFTKGAFPPHIPTSAHDVVPDFRAITRSASEANFRRVRRAALLDPDQITSIAVPYVSEDLAISSAASDAPTRSVTAAIAQQEKEFQKAVQPGSPISALLSSAKRPLLRSTGPPGAPGNGVTKESPLFRKLQAVSTSNPPNPSPLRQSSATGSSRPVAAHTVNRGLEHIAEEDDRNDELGRKRKNQTKELEAQKARIVAQMAPVREEERYEAGAQDRYEDPQPERKEIKRSSVREVKENRFPVPSAPIPELKAQLAGFDAAAHVLTLAFESKAVGQVFRDPREDPRIPLPEEKVFIVSWVDYCNKYGMGYALTDGSVGVHFNDSSSIVLSADKHHFDVISSRRNGTVFVRKSFTVEEYPEELQTKVYLLKHFERYIMDRLYGEYDYTFEDTEKTKGMIWVQNYLRMKQVIVFKLSHDVLQFNFYDHSKIILSSSGLVVTHIDKNSVLTRWLLSDIMHNALRAASSTSTANPDTVKFNQKLVDKLKYCKEVLVSIQTAKTSGSDATPTSNIPGSTVGNSVGLPDKALKASLR
ncbi:kinase-like domain-containing protein [Lentinula edodes]|uniref:kinase-like domain-containing protein n=1 Tax=Lentinula edodes TaxID=5353 RepID=UPI001E8CF0EC|nr:kinase-like domain-containing protein [Lentinula edodes]KAH7878481.1 kinase-like domain-containing protein [Lentinula edodes]KAJ3908824.1 kinase-like domain-containing protein [Lentinula edodes]